MSGPRIPRWPAKRPAQPAPASTAAKQSRVEQLYIMVGGHITRQQCERLADNDSMWAPERDRPWMLLAYAVVIVFTLAASAIFPWGSQ